MKKIFLFSILLFSLFLSACSSKSEPPQTKRYETQKTDVVDVFGEVERIELFEDFLKNIEEDKNSTLRIVRLTNEGEHLIWNLDYKDNYIHAIYDTSYDSYSSRETYVHKCSTIIPKTIDSNFTEYHLSDCEDKTLITLLFTSFNN